MLLSDPSALFQLLSERPGIDGRYLVWGLGHEYTFDVPIRNDSDRALQIVGPIQARSAAIDVSEPARHEGALLLPGQADGGVSVRLTVRPDRLERSAFPSDAQGVLRLALDLTVGLRAPQRRGADRVERVHVADIPVKVPELDWQTELFVDLTPDYVCVALVGADGVPVMIDIDPTDDQDFLVVVLFRDHGSVEVDYTAACEFGAVSHQQMEIDANIWLSGARGFTSSIGQSPARYWHVVDYNGRVRGWSADQLAGLLLRHVFDAVKQQLSQPPAQVYLSVPVHFTSHRREALRRIASDAFHGAPFPGPVRAAPPGTEIAVHCSRAAALVLSLGSGSPPRLHLGAGVERTVAVFDVGGDTTVAVVTRVRCALDPDTDYECVEFDHLARTTWPEGARHLTHRIAGAIWPRVAAELVHCVSEETDGVTLRRLSAMITSFEMSMDPRAPAAAQPGSAHREISRSLLCAVEAWQDAQGWPAYHGFHVDGFAGVVNLAPLDDEDELHEAVAAFVGPKLQALKRLEARLVAERPEAGFDAVYLAGESARTPGVLALARDQFGDRVIPASASAGQEVVKGMAWATARNIFLEEAECSGPTGWALGYRRRWFGQDQPCEAIFLPSSFLRIMPLDRFGERIDRQVAVFRLRKALPAGRERLQATLRVHQRGSDDSDVCSDVRFTVDIAEPLAKESDTGRVLAWKHRCTLHPE